MVTVSVSELKANLSRYLRQVRRGGEVQVLDRGQPVARITSLPTDPTLTDERRARLIRDGTLRPGTGDVSCVLEEPPLTLPVALSRTVVEDRDDRL